MPFAERAVHRSRRTPGLEERSSTKIGEREKTLTRLVNKDAHDLYRILRAVSTNELVTAFERLLHNDGSRQTIEQALVFSRAPLFDWT
jgi:hypothetical protein